MVVIIDSAVGLHQGGQVCAPVFQRVMQQALEYLNVSHDIDVKAPRSLATTLKDSDLDESSPDRLAAGPEMAVADMPGEKPAAAAPPAQMSSAALTQASLTPASATVVMDVESGGLVVPSLIGKSVRAAVEVAQETGFEIDVIGEGIAREQTPAAGAHIAPGGRVAVRFAP